MKFIDTARVEIQAGSGGPGAVSFQREKFKPRGRPDGGDGGRGGDIYARVNPQLRSLLDYKYRQHFKAQAGVAGSSRDCAGKDAEDLILPVPPGTLIFDNATGRVLAELVNDDDCVLIAKGGRGGKGNAHFCSSTFRSPRFAQPGEPGELMTIRLELKLLADVGLVGLPNAGKSSLLRAVTAAHPKVADYPFTTLSPQLGVVQGPDGATYVMADIPGLIEGASEGAGLGHEFLRHVERTRLLFHLIDISELAALPPDRAFRMIEEELGRYDAKLLKKARWAVLTKTDLVTPDIVQMWTEKFSRWGVNVFPISSATRSGLDHLSKKALTWVLDHTPKTQQQPQHGVL